VVPGSEEVFRLVIYLIASILYIAFWLGISILFSVIFRSTATSALASLAVWIFFSFFLGLGAGFMADAVAPIGQSGTGVDPSAVINMNRFRGRSLFFLP
jgi:ABC-2 type transport system permease protein